MIPLEEAQRLVLERCHALTARRVQIAEALGCVLSAAVVAPEAVPPFANTAVDGFAVRAADSDPQRGPIRVIGTIAAGAPPEPAIGPGESVRILTGAPIPPGADAVVMVENTTVDGSTLLVHLAVDEGENVRPAGSDIAAGETVFEAGSAVTPAHIGVLASLGLAEVEVIGRPVVGVLSTGDELVVGGGPLGPGQIRESNRPMLLAVVGQAGAIPVDLGVVRDDEGAIEAALAAAAKRCDAILTSGGVSVGDFDYVKVVLDRLSAQTMHWMQVAIRPAKPFAFGTIGGVPVFGLPGNPVSSLVSFECFARPALRKMMGHAVLERAEVDAIADQPLRRRPDGRVAFVRVRASWADGGFHVTSSGAQGSHQLHSTSFANALAVLPDGDGIGAGEHVRVRLLAWPE